MKKVLVVFLALMFLLAGCGSGGVAQADYDELCEEYDDLEAEYSELEDSYDDLEKSYDDLLEKSRKYDKLQADYDLLKAEYDLITSEDYSETFIMDAMIKQISEDAVGGKVGNRYVAIFPIEEVYSAKDNVELLSLIHI